MVFRQCRVISEQIIADSYADWLISCFIGEKKKNRKKATLLEYIFFLLMTYTNIHQCSIVELLQKMCKGACRQIW